MRYAEKDIGAEFVNKTEKNLRWRRHQNSPGTRQEHGHKITSLSRERAKKRKTEAREIVQQVRKLGLDADTLAKIDAAAKAHAQSPENWIFVMLSPAQNAEVIDWLQNHSKRPHKAVMVWARMLEHLRMDTGEIMATRQELAERVGLPPRDLSSIMTELVVINAVRREREGRNVRYFLNPGIATHIPNATARTKAREDAGPLLKLMEAGEDR